jgi:transposase-like protein
MKAYSLDLRTKIVESVRRGISISETARRFGINRSTVARYLKRLDENGSLTPKKAPGWMEAPCGCLRKTSRAVRGLPTNTGASFSLQLAELG